MLILLAETKLRAMSLNIGSWYGIQVPIQVAKEKNAFFPRLPQSQKILFFILNVTWYSGPKKNHKSFSQI